MNYYGNAQKQITGTGQDEHGCYQRLFTSHPGPPYELN